MSAPGQLGGKGLQLRRSKAHEAGLWNAHATRSLRFPPDEARAWSGQGDRELGRRSQWVWGAPRELGGGRTEEGAEGWKGGGVLKVAVGREEKADSPRAGPAAESEMPSYGA